MTGCPKISFWIPTALAKIFFSHIIINCTNFCSPPFHPCIKFAYPPLSAPAPPPTPTLQLLTGPLNYTLLIAKYSIYSKCLHDEKLCFDSFLSLLMEKANIQRAIAIPNNKLTTFNEI